MSLISGRVSKIPRLWSNRELRRLAPRFCGDVVNVSAWKDEDKEGRHYRDYFSSARSYSITNFVADKRGVQGIEGEIFLDLEAPLPAEMFGRYDVVFNHTVLEHIYDFHTALTNLAAMSRDVLILVVPFLQPYHSEYGDYWRFTPLAMKRLHEANNLSLVHCDFNDQWMTSVYLLTVGTRYPDRWRNDFPNGFSLKKARTGEVAGERAIPKLGPRLKRLFGGGE